MKLEDRSDFPMAPGSCYADNPRLKPGVNMKYLGRKYLGGKYFGGKIPW
jgi:hypothetical protein